MNFYSISAEEALKLMGSNINGLDDETVQKKIEEHGKNELKGKKKVSPLVIFVRQFLDFMILVLIAAAIVSAFIGEGSDTIVIIIIIVLNAIIGFIQEYRAEKAIEALQKMAAPISHVLRNGNVVELPAADIVPGDIVLLEAGNTVPADMRLIEIESLKASEASLTGESNPVDKRTDALKDEDPPLGDRTNMVFKGTQITSGHGKAVVVATGMKTELGNIAGMLDKAESVTPLQKRLTQFSRRLTVIIIGLCVVFFAVGYWQGGDLSQMLLTAISLAVAAIPEALPAVVTISLALGARRLMKQNVLIRKLYAVETLGSVTYICTDKTGTLTKNEMIVQEIWVQDESKREELLQAMSLNHDVKEKDGKLTGDPTEIAMVEYAKKQADHKRVKEIPFDSDRKAMTTIHERGEKFWVITKGAAELITEINHDEGIKGQIKEQEEKMAKNGMRVIGFAGKEIHEIPSEVKPETIEKEMHFIGLAGLIDPPREEAKQAIHECKAAGIVPVMITGDHPLTAESIARQLGIIDNEDQKVVTGVELAKNKAENLETDVERIRVYARVSPEQKLRIVEALQNKQQFVSMTGDGVNDAPSLKKANIGVAMGITGTDVTKEAAHMILLDDNFATIVKAVKTGRRVYDNIRKFIKYILTGNTAEIWTLFLAPIIGLPIPLLPVHILWINLVTDGLPALALATEPAERSIMEQPPRSPNESIFAKGLGIHILWVGIFIGMLTIATQWFAISFGDTHWQTLVFTVLCFCQLWHVMAIRSEIRSLFKLGLFTNKPLLLAVFGTVLLQLAVIYIPSLNKFFHTEPLTLVEMLAAFGISSLVFFVVELEKKVKRIVKKSSPKR
ncbi:cation-translocating P-type ATPase [Terrimonas pollutisoli]|uniref:cation-translocating P-type ATPase n=1 Tax=Terrimonas pollutisoli TaxID=3034147 RepID=UPI0023EC400B|nr:cation-translocating P-type ATPase [Terrimonas sp. H1YJ31]